MITLTINGAPHATGADPATPLLYVLRNELGLNGAKFGCGLGQCGACTVILDDRAVFSCITPIALLPGRAIRTIEGLGSAGAANPVQQAFITEQAAQCGYCIAGMVMRAQALLEGNPDADDAAIRTGMQPNLCRCGTHMRILRAVHRAGASHARPAAGASHAGAGGDTMNTAALSRRGVLGGGALLVGFAFSGFPRAAELPVRLPGALADTPMLDAWIAVDATGAVTVFTGKAELGQGISTALLQLAADQLWLPIARLSLITADTARTPDEGMTAGSHSMQDSGTAIMNAAAQVRALLIEAAARQFGVPAAQLNTQDGQVHAPDGRHLDYGGLAAAASLHQAARPAYGLREPKTYALIGAPVPRIDIPAKVTGGAAYVQDLRLPGMVHARVVRPPGYDAALIGIDDEASIAKLPGVFRLVRDGSFLAVVAREEFQAIAAMRALAAAAHWQTGRTLPEASRLQEVLLGLPTQDSVNLDRLSAAAPSVRSLRARYSRPYIAHAAIGPSCAVARMTDTRLTVWTHTQGVYPLRNAIAGMLGMDPEAVDCIHTPGSGCYGHNGADDVAADAALVARALPGVPVRLQWMREQEMTNPPFGVAMITELQGALDEAGSVVDWQFAVWSNTHDRRPRVAGLLLAAQSLQKPFTPPPPKPIPMPEGGGDRNSLPIYDFPSVRVLHHFIPQMPLRVSASRSLGAHLNVFAIESFIDELAAAAGADPISFRLRHLSDTRARDVMMLAAQRFGWAGAVTTPGHGRGFAFARYKNLAAYCAIALEASVERESGIVQVGRVVAAVDSGQAVNPDGIRNQIEGGIIQTLSWTMLEQVSFDRSRITSQDWGGYPILRFDQVPQSIEVHVIDRPGMPFLGTGEAAQGPGAAALANAVFDAVGVRMRDLPLSPLRVKAALGV